MEVPKKKLKKSSNVIFSIIWIFKTYWFQFVGKKVQNQITTNLNYFKNLKENVVFMKEPIENQEVYGQLFDLKKKSKDNGYIA